MADQKTIEQRVKEIIVNQLNVNEEQITPTASFLDDLGADSLDTVELIMAFEEEFKEEIKGEIPESDAEKLQTVGQVIDYIKANKQWASKDNLKVARDAQTVKALGQAMSKSKPKETTLNYKQIMDGRRAEGRSRAEAQHQEMPDQLVKEEVAQIQPGRRMPPDLGRDPKLQKALRLL
jgi:acyl carrier protein